MQQLGIGRPCCLTAGAHGFWVGAQQLLVLLVVFWGGVTKHSD